MEIARIIHDVCVLRAVGGHTVGLARFGNKIPETPAAMVQLGFRLLQPQHRSVDLPVRHVGFLDNAANGVPLGRALFYQ